jgi:CrcB protein
MTSATAPLRFALVFGGAALGGLLRFGIDRAVTLTHAWELVAINVIGSIALGVLAGWSAERPRPVLYAFAGPGLLGGFTTFSAMAAFAWGDAGVSGHVALLLGTTVAAVGGAAAGWVVGNRRAHGGDVPPGAEVVP